MTIVQTAGRDALGDFAPNFAHFNDDVLFGENWNDDALDLKCRCIVTMCALIASGITDSSLTYHLENAKAHGVTREEAAAIITHLAFYAGWPKAWAAFRLATDVWTEPTPAADVDEAALAKYQFQARILFPIGEPNDAFAPYFDGQSYLAKVADGPLPIYNVTFEPGCRNHWHIHHASSGGGQVLICIGGRGWYQAWGEEAVALEPGAIVEIPANVKHWHGAAKDSWMAHLAFDIPGVGCENEWLEAVDTKEYFALP